MDITWFGHSCFRLSERNLATVVTDPFDSQVTGYKAIKTRGDIVTISHDAPGHNHTSVVKGSKHILTGPGEFEIGDVFITAVRTNGSSKQAGDGPRNTLYVFDYNGVAVAHLGDLRRVPSRTEVEALGNVNVVLVPVGGGGGLNAAKAAEVVSLLEPGIVIPMHYSTPDCKIGLDPVTRFLKEMGLGSLEPQPSLKITPSSIPTETRVVVLSYERG